MNIIENGDFETGTAEPWTTINGAASEFEVVDFNHKNWILTNGMDGPSEGSLLQKIPGSDTSWGNDFRLTLTAKALPTGAVKTDNDVARLRAKLNLYFSIHFMGSISDNIGTYAEISVRETTYSLRFKLIYSQPASHAELAIMNWGGGAWDEANILITDIRVDLVDPELDPEEPAEAVIRLDLSGVGLPVLNAPRMKEVR